MNEFSVLRCPGFGCATENFINISHQKRCEKRRIPREFHSAGVQRWQFWGLKTRFLKAFQSLISCLDQSPVTKARFARLRHQFFPKVLWYKWGGVFRAFLNLWFAKPMVCARVALHENDGNHENDENDEDNSDSYKQGVEWWIRGKHGNHKNDENHGNPGCKT